MTTGDEHTAGGATSSCETGYADAAPLYLARGWTGVNPMSPSGKGLPPKGVTGHHGIDPTPEQIKQWRQTRAGHNLFLRVPETVIGIDVDDYTTEGGSAKHGGTTLAYAESLWGPLPPTVRSTSRADRVSGIRLYRIPADSPLTAGVLAFDIERDDGTLAKIADVEIIQHHHRYVLCWPSVHPRSRRRYRWLDQDGNDAGIPAPDELPELPAAWLHGLAAMRGGRRISPGTPSGSGGRAAGKGRRSSAEDTALVEAALTDGDMSPLVASRFAEAVDDCDGASRYDATRDHTLALLRYGHEGEPGVGESIAALREVYAAAVAADRAGGIAAAYAEFDRFTTGAGHLLAGGPATIDGDEMSAGANRSGEGAGGDGAMSLGLTVGAAGRMDVRVLARLSAADRYKDNILGELLARDRLEGHYVHSDALGWMGYDGRRWAHVEDAVVFEVLREGVRDLLVIAAKGGPGNADILDIAKAQTGARLSALVKVATAYMTLRPGLAFDTHPDLLNVGNGVVDLRTGELLPHDPSLLLSRITPVNYAAGATHEDWDQACEALPSDAVDWFGTCVGQGATGHRTGGAHPWTYTLHGPGSNGKTTFWEAIKASLGEHYVQPSERAVAPPPGAHPTELMTFRGARVAVIEELPEGVTLASKRIKDLSGGQSEITARGICKDDTTFPVTHTLFVTTNHLPRVTATDHGTWRRLKRVPFPYTFRIRGEENLRNDFDKWGDPDLETRMTQDAGGGRREAVLAWVVEGAMRWYAGGKRLPQPPASVRDATEEWRRGVDTVGQFFEDQLVLDPHSHVMSSELYEAFCAWLGGAGAATWNDQTFIARLTEHCVLGEQLERRRLRHNKLTHQTLSRRWSMVQTTPPGRYFAWLGVRFRTADDDCKEDEGKTEVSS